MTVHRCGAKALARSWRLTGAAMACAMVLAFCTGCPTSGGFDTAMYQLRTADGTVRPYWYGEYYRVYLLLPTAVNSWELLTPVGTGSNRNPPVSPNSALQRVGTVDITHKSHDICNAIREHLELNPHLISHNWYLVSADPLLVGCSRSSSAVVDFAAVRYDADGIEVVADSDPRMKRMGVASSNLSPGARYALRNGEKFDWWNEYGRNVGFALVLIDESIEFDAVYRVVDYLVEVPDYPRSLPGITLPDSAP